MEQQDLGINYVAVLVATVANFIVGFLWYTPLFGKAWAKEIGMDPTGKPTSGQMARGLVMGFIGNLFLAYVFAHNNAAWTFVPGMKEMSAGPTIFMAAVFTWLGFYLPVDMNRVAWEGAS